jgi:predicted permease
LSILRWLTDAALADAILGDLAEERRARAAASPLGAAWWYWRALAAVVVAVAWRRATRGAGTTTAARTGVHGLGGEIRQAARTAVRTPVTSLAIVATLALGIGLNAAIFSVVHGVLFRPLPFQDPDRVVLIESRQGDADPSIFGTSYLDFVDFRDANRTFAGVASSAYWTFTVTGTEVPLRLIGMRVSGNFFPLLGMKPALGRWIEAADDRPGADEVAVLSHGLWQRMYGGDRDVIGRPIELNGVHARVVGVMPEGFRFPAEGSELWVAMREELTVPRVSRFFITVGRLADGVSIEAAGADLAAITSGLLREYPEAYRDWHPVVTHALAGLTAEVRPRLWLLFTAVVVVLVVACVNVAALLAARGATRAREFAVRVALGASYWRLFRVTALESAWFGVAGLAAGLLVAAPAVSWLRALAPADIPRLDNVALSWPVMAWAAVVMIGFVFAGALAPLVRLARIRPDDFRRATVAGGSASFGRRALVAGQVAGAFALLVAAGLLMRSFSRVLDVNPGFNPDNVLVMRVFLTPPTYRTTDEQKRYVDIALERLVGTPGVAAVGAVTQPPFDQEGAGVRLDIALEGQTYAAGTNPSARYIGVSPGYFQAIGVSMLRGRGIEPTDRVDTDRVLVVNETMAARMWPGEDPIGKRLEFADGRGAGLHTVVGVVPDVATSGLEIGEGPAAYAPNSQRSLGFLRWMTFVVRSETDAARALPSIRTSLQALDPNQPIYAVDTMDAIIRRSVAERRFSLALMSGFAGLTLLLAAIGLYGALAQSVAARTRDIGVRLAIGAGPARVFRLVVGEGLRVVGAGLAIGAALAIVLSRRVEDLLFGVAPLDAVTYAAIAVVLAAVGLTASVLPALRASRVDPVTALRAE